MDRLLSGLGDIVSGSVLGGRRSRAARSRLKADSVGPHSRRGRDGLFPDIKVLHPGVQHPSAHLEYGLVARGALELQHIRDDPEIQRKTHFARLHEIRLVPSSWPRFSPSTRRKSSSREPPQRWSSSTRSRLSPVRDTIWGQSRNTGKRTGPIPTARLLFVEDTADTSAAGSVEVRV